MYKHLLSKSRDCIGLMLVLGLAACTSPAHNNSVNAAGAECADTLFINGKVRTVSGNENQNDDDRFVAVHGNKILAVLGSSDIGKYRCDTTKTIDLDGKTIMPGFVEPHTHPDLAGQLGEWVDISGITGCGGKGCKNWQQVKDILEKAVQDANEDIDETDANVIREKKKKRWIYAFGYDPILTAYLKDLSIFDTDEIAPDNPMLIMLQSMHTVYANSIAMSVSGVEEYVWGQDHEKDIPNQPAAGTIVLFSNDSNLVAQEEARVSCEEGLNSLTPEECKMASQKIKAGDPTGRFEEAGAIHLIIAEAIDPDVEKIKKENQDKQMIDGVPDIIKEYGSVGITTVGVPGMDQQAATLLFEGLDEDSGHPEWLRTFWYSNPEGDRPIDTFKDPTCLPYKQSPGTSVLNNEGVEKKLNSIQFNKKESVSISSVDSDSSEKLTPNIFERLGTKFWYDGSPYSASMFMNESYLNTLLMKELGAQIPGPWCGSPNYSEQRLRDMLKGAHEKKWQLSVHSQGDRSSEEVIKIIKQVMNETPVEDPRPRLEHLALINEDQVKEAVEAGILLNFHILHLYYYGEALRDKMIGEDRARRLMPIKWALDAGSKFALHTDAPMYPPNPLLTVRTAVTRLMKDTGQKLGSMMAIPVDEAIKAITINAAYQLKMEDYIGSIEVGKYADFVILKEDPYEVAAPNINEIEVCETYVNGKKKYNIESDDLKQVDGKKSNCG